MKNNNSEIGKQENNILYDNEEFLSDGKKGCGIIKKVIYDNIELVNNEVDKNLGLNLEL